MERWQLPQVFEVWIDAEEGPTGEARVNRPDQPRHGFFSVTQEGVNADLSPVQKCRYRKSVPTVFEGQSTR